MTEATYELDQVAASHLPRRWKPDYARRWLRERLARGELHGVKFGRDWRMRERDIEHMLKVHSNESVQPATISSDFSVADGLSERSRRRLRRSA